MTNGLFDVADETWNRYGLMKVVRSGNGFAWQVFGQGNFVRPLFEGREGSFYDAKAKAERCLEKDLKEIFWILNEASTKERKEGEGGDAELIEQVIRSLNGGDKKAALVALDKILAREKAEKEPGDVKRLQLARTLILAEKAVVKDGSTTYEPCPACASGHLGMVGGKPRDLKCPECGGSGMKITEKSGACPDCGGEVEEGSWINPATGRMRRECADCSWHESDEE